MPYPNARKVLQIVCFKNNLCTYYSESFMSTKNKAGLCLQMIRCFVLKRQLYRGHGNMFLDSLFDVALIFQNTEIGS